MIAVGYVPLTIRTMSTRITFVHFPDSRKLVFRTFQRIVNVNGTPSSRFLNSIAQSVKPSKIASSICLGSSISNIASINGGVDSFKQGIAINVQLFRLLQLKYDLQDRLPVPPGEHQQLSLYVDFMNETCFKVRQNTLYEPKRHCDTGLKSRNIASITRLDMDHQ